jgi:cation diffusion facilitator family transporter
MARDRLGRMDSISRTRAVRRVLWMVLLLNLIVTAIKLVVGLASGSLAIVADAFHSVVDSSGNIVGLLGLWVAGRPADENHPYGHHKYETIATLTIGAMLLVAAFEIGRGVVQRLTGLAPAVSNISPETIGLMAVTFLINIGVTIYETRAGRRLNSSIIQADAMHTRTDLWVTLSVIASLIGTRLGLRWVDSVVAAGVVFLLVRAAYGILRSSSEELTDGASLDPAALQMIARGVAGVSDVAAVRSRGRADAIYVDLHIKVNPAMDADQAHGVASEVERRIADKLPGVVDTVVHVEPQWAGDTATSWEALAFKLRGVADGLGLGLHDLHAHVENGGGYAVEVHLELSASLNLGEAHLVAEQFEARARELVPDLRSLITHLEPLPTEMPGEAGRLTSARRHTLERRLAALADDLAGAGACHNVELHEVNGRLTATLHVTQPADRPLTEAHALAEAIERRLHAREHSLGRVVVHVEPPE